MTTDFRPPFSDAQRMELRSYVQLAGEVIAPYWPMRTFIHHNPLHGLETLPFEEAIKQGADLFGGRGYLRNEQFRAYYRAGRITPEDLRRSLRPLAVDKRVLLGSRSVSHREVMETSMVHGVTEQDAERADPQRDSDHALIDRVASWLRSIAGPQGVSTSAPSMSGDPGHPSIAEVLANWSDRMLGTQILDTVNREMIKWCSAFLDEGEAAWRMPCRDRTFYRSWRAVAQYDATLRLLGIRDAGKKIGALPDRPEDAVLESLARLKIPKAEWEHYLAQHLAALPGWTGYIKWRADHNAHPWQQRYPIDLVKYLAVRLFYERELVDRYCRERLGIAGDRDEIQSYVRAHPAGAWLRQVWLGGELPPPVAKKVRRLVKVGKQGDLRALEELGSRQIRESAAQRFEDQTRSRTRSLLRLAYALSIDSATIDSTGPSDARTVLDWLDGFPPEHHGPIWLEAFETSYRRRAVADLQVGVRDARNGERAAGTESASRPFAHVVFCIDVRSEVLRRHLEQRGGYETLGLAGFFGVPLDYQPFGAQHQVTQCPVLLRPKNQVREVPRSYHGAVAERHKVFLQLSRAAQRLLHDLKENVVTPYVMVEAIGWFFSAPFFGKTLLPRWYHAFGRWLKTLLMPSLATTLTVDKITREEAEAMVAGEQQAAIRELLRAQPGIHGVALTPSLLERIRKRALGEDDDSEGQGGKTLLPALDEEQLYRHLREDRGISPRGVSERLERLTQTGFTTSEQAYFVEAALRLMGLTTNFARVVLFCAHGSTSQNNPYESALDCGACGGNQGLPNARTIATMANLPAVRDLLHGRGLIIPSDTHFCAAQHDTTSDTVRIVDLEDVPPTHLKDIQRLTDDLREAGRHAALERGALLESSRGSMDPALAQVRAQRRSDDWAQVRPEWGLSRNSLMVIGRRALTLTVNLHGRSFLHSYDHRQDSTGRLLESIMTAPLVVAQWINMEHYFSTVDNEVYGSGSKIYHNVVGRIGVMTGVSSDLRLGLPAQTVLDGPVPYHEPMRLLAIIEAPLDRIRTIIARQPLLEQLFRLGWASLVALDPHTGECYRYSGRTGWTPVEGGDHDQLDVASHERDQNRGPGRPDEVCH